VSSPNEEDSRLVRKLVLLALDLEIDLAAATSDQAYIDSHTTHRIASRKLACPRTMFDQVGELESDDQPKSTTILSTCNPSRGGKTCPRNQP
jgi:hypothetical protein